MRNSMLIVCDDPLLIEVLAGALAGVADLTFATNGTDAIRLLREATSDLVLLDAQMPGMSGFPVFDTIKSNRAIPTCGSFS